MKDRYTEPTKQPSDESEFKKILKRVVIAIFISFIILLFYKQSVPQVDEKDEQSVSQVDDERIILFRELAERHYEHPAFWVYIYKANEDTFADTLNFDRTIFIPDIAGEYDVDVTDSLEIQRANFIGEIILNLLKSKK